MVNHPSASEGKDRLRKFQSLVVKASVDMKTVDALSMVPQLGVQMIQDNEELRANYGFTGARVKWAWKEARACRQDRKEPTQRHGDPHGHPAKDHVPRRRHERPERAHGR